MTSLLLAGVVFPFVSSLVLQLGAIRFRSLTLFRIASPLLLMVTLGLLFGFPSGFPAGVLQNLIVLLPGVALLEGIRTPKWSLPFILLFAALFLLRSAVFTGNYLDGALGLATTLLLFTPVISLMSPYRTLAPRNVRIMRFLLLTYLMVAAMLAFLAASASLMQVHLALALILAPSLIRPEPPSLLEIIYMPLLGGASLYALI